MRRIISCVIAIVLCIIVASGSLAGGFTTNADAIEKAADSVLQVAGGARDSDMISLGSGFIAFNSSTMITNYHVIDGLSELYAWDDEDDNYENGYELKYILCADKEADIAILEFATPTKLQPLDLYPDDSLKRGSPVAAIGSPGGGKKNTVSTGIISSQYKNDKGYPEIQTTAAISHGSSGGALFNDEGKVIGITSATSAVEETQNINFAVNIAVAVAMYNAWDGTRYTFKNHKTSAKMDFTGVYQHTETAPAVSATVTEEKQDTSPNEAWVCLNCGKENTSKFCLECGAEKPYWVCSCGKRNSSSKFCGECGSSRNDQLDSFNTAISTAKRGGYAEAVQILESLGRFDSGSFETAGGSHAVASSYIGQMYYDMAVSLQENGGDHEAIIEAFTKAGDYGDAKDQIAGENARYLKAFYDAGIEQLNNGEYDAAIESFQKAGDYQDAVTRINSVYFAKGNALMKAKDYEGAREAWANLKEDKIIKGKIKESYYLEAEDKLKQKAYETAVELFDKAEGYSDANDRIKEVYYLLGKASLDGKDTEKAKEYFDKAGDYKDAKEIVNTLLNDEKESTYQAAEAAFNNGDYQGAIDLYEKIPGYHDADTRKIKALVTDKTNRADALLNSNNVNRIALLESEVLSRIEKYIKIDEDAEALYKWVSYEIACDYEQKDSYTRLSIQYFEQADDYMDAPHQLVQSIGNYYGQLMDNGQISQAENLYKKYVAKYKGLKDFVYIDVGSIGDKVADLLNLIKPLGIRIKGSDPGMLYLSDYIPYVKQIEEHFELDADGKITLEEYMKIRDALYSGIKSGRVSQLLEKLADLGYITGLPKDHLKYENRYLAGVKKAEKALGLQEDGIITNNEFEKILGQKVDAPDRPKNLKAAVSKDTVTLTWSAVPGAVCYEVLRNNIKIATTETPRWVDKDLETNITYYYRVRAKKYSVSGDYTSISKEVPIYYLSVSASNLANNLSSYKGKYVNMGGLRIANWTVDMGNGKYANTNTAKSTARQNGHDVYLLCRSGNTYVEIVIGNYADWDWQSEDLLAMINRITGISVKGMVRKEKSLTWGKYSNLPSININNISWNY